MTRHALPWDKKIFIIAEAGVNHNGDVKLAKKLIDGAKAAGADAVKFQTWVPGEITGRFAFKVDYLGRTTAADESRYELSKRLALSYDAFRELKSYAERAGILFLSTPDGFQSLDFLADELKMPFIKIGSTEVTHAQFLKAVSKKKRPVILSTGLSDLKEVKTAVKHLRSSANIPLVVLQCTSEYPAPDDEVNVKALVTMRKALKVPTGLSDHSMGAEAAIAAAALGARVIEKHFTLDKNMSGPDHKASLDIAELKHFVSALRRTETLLGTGVKKRTPSEEKNWRGIRRSVVARTPLRAGTKLERDMLVCKRPATGVEPRHLDSLVGKVIKRSLQEDEPIRREDVR